MNERFSVGRVFGKSVPLWARGLPLITALVFVATLPQFVYRIYEFWFPFDIPWGPFPEDSIDFGQYLAFLGPALPYWTGMTAALSLLARFAQAFVIFAVYERLRGRRASFRGALRGGLRRFRVVLQVGLALALLEFLLAMAMVALGFFLRTEQHVATYFVVAAVAFTFFVLCQFFVAIPAAVVEPAGSYLRRSWRLTRGHRFGVFAFLLLINSLDGILGLGLTRLLPHLSQWALLAMTWGTTLLFTGFAAVFAVVGYQSLRLEKEGVDVIELTNVFS